MGDVPYTYKDAKRYDMNFSMDQSAHQAKSVYFLQPFPRNYLLLKLLRALNLLSHALLEFTSYVNISDDCSLLLVYHISKQLRKSGCDIFPKSFS